MANTTHTPLTRRELEIIKIVWNLQTATVREVYETLRERRRIAYTTVLTMMRIMEGKGQLLKWQKGRAYVYKSTHPKGQIIKEMVKEFVERVFNGSAEALLTHLIDDSDRSLEDQQKIKRMIEVAAG